MGVRAVHTLLPGHPGKGLVLWPGSMLPQGSAPSCSPAPHTVTLNRDLFHKGVNFLFTPQPLMASALLLPHYKGGN